jgi:hypothetical protein
MAKREWGWEFLRFGVAIALIEKGLGPSEALREVKLGVLRWSFERRKEEMRREIEAAKAAARSGTPVEAGSQGTALPIEADTPSK